jgi:hypothetical protein
MTSCGTTIAALGYPAVGIQNATIGLWGFQIEAGSTATAFQTATGTIQGELAACQRYYFRNDGNSSGFMPLAMGFNTSTTSGRCQMRFPTTMRIAPTAIETSAAANFIVQDGASNTAVTSFTFNLANKDNASFNYDVASGLTANRPINLTANNVSVFHISFSAEL